MKDKENKFEKLKENMKAIKEDSFTPKQKREFRERFESIMRAFRQIEDSVDE